MAESEREAKLDSAGSEMPSSSARDALDVARTLTGPQRRFYLKLKREESIDRQAQAAIIGGQPPPSRVSRWFSAARTERKLVLFTLGLIVMGLIAVISLQVLRGGDGAALTPLVGLAGTGLGFIGGMVDRDKTPPTTSAVVVAGDSQDVENSRPT